MADRHWAEELAQRHLEALGWTLIEANYRIRSGEVDLVMREGDTVVFVEVRQRRTDRFGGAAASVGAAKRRRLRRTALHFMTVRFGRADLPMRIDAVLVHGTSSDHVLEHLRSIG